MSLTLKQQEFLMNCNHRWNVKVGATGSGKSFLDYTVTIPKRIQACKGEGLIVLLGNTKGTLERNILEPMREIWSPKLVGEIRNDNTITLFGRKVYALGADNKKRVSKIQGATMEYVYGDEVTTWSHEVFEMLKSRLRCDHSHFDGTCNPDSPNHWFHKFLTSDADIFLQQYVIDDGVLPPQVVEELKKEYAGTVYYDRFILGKWALAEGLCYPMYQSALADSLPVDPATGEVYPATDYVVSVDYGTLNAFAALLWSKRNGIWYAEREYYYSGRETGTQKTDEDYANDLDEWIADIWETYQTTQVRTSFLGGGAVSKIRMIVDPSAASFITLMQRRKWCKIEPADNDVKDGIRETAVAMQLGLIKILNSCKHWKDEAAGYVWTVSADGKEAPLKIADHLMDAMRYFVKTMLIAAKNGRRK